MQGSRRSPLHTTRRFFALSVAAAGAGAALAPHDAAACQCLEEYWGDMVARTDVIFRGRVISIVSLLDTEPRDLRGLSEDEARGTHLFQFAVYDALKGEVGERIEVAAYGLFQMCGSAMAMSDILLVCAMRDAALGLVTGSCNVHPDADASLARYLRTLL